MTHEMPSPDKHSFAPKIQEIQLMSPSFINKPTQRHHTIYQQSKIAQHLFDKSTQRNPITYINQHPIWLSQSNSSKQSKRQWILPSDFKQSQEIQQRKQELMILLNNNGLLQLLECFQTFREYMIENYYKIQSKDKKCIKIQLLQWIQILKVKISNINNKTFLSPHPTDKQDKSIDYTDIKELLHQITVLRNQNILLKHKIRKLNVQMRQSKDKSSLSNHSIIDNSISFHSATSSNSNSNSKDYTPLPLPTSHHQNSHHQNSINSIYTGYEIQKDRGIDGLIQDGSWLEMHHESQYQIQSKNKMIQSYNQYSICKVDVGVNCSPISQFQQCLASQSKKDSVKNIEYDQRFITRFNADVYVERMIMLNQSNWQQCLARCVKQLKSLLSSYLLSANLNLLHSKSLESFSQIISKHLPYQPIKQSSSSHNSYNPNRSLSIEQINHLIDHIASISQSIHQLIQKEVNNQIPKQ